MNKKYFFILYATLVFLLNFFWESWHAIYLYRGHGNQSFLAFSIKNYLTLITRASIIDMLMLFFILLLGIIIWNNIYWFRKMNKTKHFYFLSMALLFAVAVEIKGVYFFQQWSYNEWMPTIFGLGMSPLLQLPITGFLAIWLIKKNG